MSVCASVDSIKLSVKHELCMRLDVGGKWALVAGEFDYDSTKVRFLGETAKSPTDTILHELSQRCVKICEFIDALKQHKFNDCITILNNAGYRCHGDCENVLPLPALCNLRNQSNQENSAPFVRYGGLQGEVRNPTNDANRNRGLRTPSFDGSSNAIPYAECRNATYDFDEENKLGTGPLGTVYNGMFEKYEEKLVVKKLDVHSLSRHLSKTGFATAIDEIIAKSRCIQQLFVPIVGYSCEDTNWCIIRKYQASSTLQNLLSEKCPRPFPFHERLSIIYNIACALNLLHYYDFVHGNLKTSNIFVEEDGSVFFSDPDFQNKSRTGSDSEFRTKNFDIEKFGKIISECLTSIPTDDVMRGFYEELNNLNTSCLPNNIGNTVWNLTLNLGNKCLGQANMLEMPEILLELHNILNLNFVHGEQHQPTPAGAIANPNQSFYHLVREPSNSGSELKAVNAQLNGLNITDHSWDKQKTTKDWPDTFKAECFQQQDKNSLTTDNNSVASTVDVSMSREHYLETRQEPFEMSNVDFSPKRNIYMDARREPCESTAIDFTQNGSDITKPRQEPLNASTLDYSRCTEGYGNPKKESCITLIQYNDNKKLNTAQQHVPTFDEYHPEPQQTGSQFVSPKSAEHVHTPRIAYPPTTVESDTQGFQPSGYQAEDTEFFDSYESSSNTKEDKKFPSIFQF